MKYKELFHVIAVSQHPRQEIYEEYISRGQLAWKLANLQRKYETVFTNGSKFVPDLN